MYEHLSPAVIPILDKPNSERIKFAREDSWIEYRTVEKALKNLNELVAWPVVSRMPCRLIVGRSNNGKTSLVEKFRDNHPPSRSVEEVESLMPVVLVECPSTPHIGLFYDQILRALYSPSKPGDRPGQKLAQILRMIKTLRVKVIILDEIHQLLQGTPAKQRALLGEIRFITNECKVCIVGAGTKDAFRFISSDEQMSNRFDPIILPQWQYDDDYEDLVYNLESTLPLKEPSNLIDEKTIKRLLNLSDGTIGDLCRFLSDCTSFAIESGRESIDDHVLAAIEADWTRPSQRQKPSSRI